MPMACQEHLKNTNKNCINLSFSLVETRVPGGKPLQAKLRADYFINAIALSWIVRLAQSFSKYFDGHSG
jgi:hypothetical protein